MHREIKIFTDAFSRFFQPVIAASATASNAKALMLNLGYLPPEQFRVFDNLRARVNSIQDVIEAMEELSEEEIEANPQLLLDTIRNGVDSISGLISDIQNLPSLLQSELNGSDLLAQTDVLERLPLKLYDFLTIRYLKEYHNSVYSALKLFGVIEVKEIREASNPFFFPRLERTFHWDKTAELLTSPTELLKTSLKDNNGYFYEKTMQVLQEVGLSIGVIPHYRDPEPDVLKFINNDPLIDTWPGFKDLEILRFPLIPRNVDSLGLDIYPLINTADNRIKGLVSVLRVDPEEKVFVISDDLKLEIEASGVANGLGIVLDENDEFRFLADLFTSPQNLQDNAQFEFRARLTRNEVAGGNDTEKLFRLGTADGTRFEIGSYNVTFGIEKKKNARIYLETELLDCFIRMKFDDADGFISKVLGDGIESGFSLGLGFSNDQGFYFAGSSGLQIELPTHITLGPLQIQNVSVGITSTEEKIMFTFASSVLVNAGPLRLFVQDIGVSFPGKSETAVFVSNVTFKPPKGVGLAIDASAVVGAGFLSFDPDKGQYEGFVQLTINEFLTVTAIGIITTKLPNGVRGFSMVVMITAEGFKPIQLGLGFALTKIGGLVAINRTCNEQFLREGVKTNSLDSLLFPKDPIRNAPQIFGVLNNAFPARPNSYLFGPVVQISWGTPALLTMNLALILELGGRTRLIVLGVVKAIMPSEKHDLIRLQMNAIGIIDFDQKSISIDAVLFDSRLAGKFPITGSMAMRLRWGSAPMFALSIGGFHPAFKPPANFPVLQRLAISFSNSESFRLRAECYFAITSNTLQFGSRMELYAKAAGFSIEGQIGYDVLIQFDPFFFIADFYASVQLKRGSHNLFKVKVEGKLSGPRPLHVKGKATFEIFWCDFSVRFEKTLVSGDPPPALAPIDVLAQLLAALGDVRSWAGSLPESDRRLVTLREEASTGQVSYHPLEALSVNQKVVPLGLEIARFGSSTPSGARIFTISNLSVNGKETKFEPLLDFFAPAQFLELSDDEKLLAPSFEQMMSGIRLTRAGYVFPSIETDILEDEAIAYETIIIDRESEAAGEPTRKAPGFSISPELLRRSIGFGAAALSPVSRTGSARYRPAAAKNVPAQKGWTVVSTEDGSPQGAPGLEAGKIVSYSESFQALQKLKQEDPSTAKKLMLVRISVN